MGCFASLVVAPSVGQAAQKCYGFLPHYRLAVRPSDLLPSGRLVKLISLARCLARELCIVHTR